MAPGQAAESFFPSLGPRFPPTALEMVTAAQQQRAIAPLAGRTPFGLSSDEPSAVHEMAEPHHETADVGGVSGAPIQFACASDCECTKCSAKKQDESVERKLRAAGIQRAADGGPMRVDPGAIQARLTGGAALPAPVSGRFSAAYGRDLSNVRVHAESGLARDLGAHAFTVGRDIAFAPGEYRPGTAAGDRLIGHELAHVVQQAGGAGAVQGAGLGEDHYEREADHAVEAALSGRSVAGLSAVAGPTSRRDTVSRAERVIQRSPLDPADPKAWGTLGDLHSRGKFSDVFFETLSESEGARAKVEGELKDRQPPQTDEEHEAFARELKTLVRLSALGLMGSHRSSITFRRDEMLQDLRAKPKPGAEGASPRAEVAEDLAQAAKVALELGGLKKRLEGYRDNLHLVEAEADKPSSDPPFADWFKALIDNTEEHRGREAWSILVGLKTASSRASLRNLPLIYFGNARALKELRERQIDGVSLALSKVYEVAPFLAKVDPMAIFLASNEDVLLSRVSNGYEELLAKVDEAIARIGAEDGIDPLDLPLAVSAVKASLPASLKPEVDRAVDAHQYSEFWWSIGLTAAQAALVLLPVVGEIAVLARTGAFAARAGMLLEAGATMSAAPLYAQGVAAATPWLVTGSGVVMTGMQVREMQARDAVAGASTSPDQTMLGVGKASPLEWAMRAAELILAAVDIRTNLKASAEAGALRQAHIELAGMEGEEHALPGAHPDAEPKARSEQEEERPVAGAEERPLRAEEVSRPAEDAPPRGVEKTGELDTDVLTGPELDAELEYLSAHPERSGRIGRHEWIEEPDGMTWCRHSDTKGGCRIPHGLPFGWEERPSGVAVKIPWAEGVPAAGEVGQARSIWMPGDPAPAGPSNIWLPDEAFSTAACGTAAPGVVGGQGVTYGSFEGFPYVQTAPPLAQGSGAYESAVEMIGIMKQKTPAELFETLAVSSLQLSDGRYVVAFSSGPKRTADIYASFGYKGPGTGYVPGEFILAPADLKLKGTHGYPKGTLKPVEPNTPYPWSPTLTAKGRPGRAGCALPVSTATYRSQFPASMGSARPAVTDLIEVWGGTEASQFTYPGITNPTMVSCPSCLHNMGPIMRDVPLDLSRGAR
jgi:hypothetical protein